MNVSSVCVCASVRVWETKVKRMAPDEFNLTTFLPCAFAPIFLPAASILITLSGVIKIPWNGPYRRRRKKRRRRKRRRKKRTRLRR